MLGRTNYADRSSITLCMRLGEQLARYGMLLATFVHERKHRRIKKAAECRESKINMEVGMIEDLTVNQLHEMMRPFLKDIGLHHAVAVPETVKAFLIEDGVASIASTAPHWHKAYGPQSSGVQRRCCSIFAGRRLHRSWRSGVPCHYRWAALDLCFTVANC